MTHVDLFSGIGGFSLAFESEGFETIAFAEIDPYASAVLKKHWPDVKNYGDVRNFPAIRCDVLTGGFPCQPFSVAGHQRGEDDDRFLWPAMLDAVKACRPTWVVGENVPGITKMELDCCCDELEDIGYAAQPFNIPACSVGAFHLRERIWIVAYNASFDLEKSQMVSPARTISQSGNAWLGSSDCLWKPDRQTYLSDMAGEIHGLPDWPHRAKCIGNAIVPQIAKVFAQAIKKEMLK